jgi:NAD(P)H-dependent FMN reductase
MKKLLAISGSSRMHSLNQALLSCAAQLARSKGATVDVLDLKALDLPLYDGDLEAANGLPDGVRTLKEAMRSVDGFLIASPEYNSFPTPLLLNAIDWASRPEKENEPSLVAFKGKTAALISASPGPLGGLRSLTALRNKLQNIGVTVVPTLTAVGSASEEMFSDENFASSSNGRRLDSALNSLLSLTV